jgi:hypothetical protein
MSPSLMLVDTTPHEVWLGKKPSVSHITVFGCDAFVHVPKEKRSTLDKKAVKCIFIGYKEGMKGYNLRDPASRKTMYNRDVVFREVGGKFEPEEIVQTENNPETMRFEMRNKEYDSDESTESEEEVEHQNLIVRRLERVIKLVERYSLSDFYSTFVLTSFDDDPKSISEAIGSVEGKPWKDAMVEDMESLHKNETWVLVKLLSGRKLVGRKWVFEKKMNAVGKVENFKS